MPTEREVPKDIHAEAVGIAGRAHLLIMSAKVMDDPRASKDVVARVGRSLDLVESTFKAHYGLLGAELKTLQREEEIAGLSNNDAEMARKSRTLLRETEEFVSRCRASSTTILPSDMLLSMIDNVRWEIHELNDLPTG